MNEMKIIGVAILAMIVLGVAQVDHKPHFGEVESNVGCKVKCAFKCEVYLPEPPIYSKCLTDCRKKCDQIFNDLVNDCITSCGFFKYSNSCLEQCKNNNNSFQ